MKTPLLLAASALLCFNAPAQRPTEASSVPAIPAQAASPRYEVGGRGSSHKVWNKITEATDADGQVILTTNQAFVELGSGMHFLKNGAWTETAEEFQLVPGWAMAANGSHRVGVAYNLNVRGSVAVTMPGGQQLRSHLSALYLMDSTANKSVLLAEVKDCEGKLYPPNQVIFENAFGDDLKADVRYIYTKAGLEQDIILRQQVPSPSQFGLDPASTWLVALTEFVNLPDAKVLRRNPNPPDLTLPPEQSMRLDDEDVSFGPMQIIRGKAFSISPNDSSARPRKLEVPVQKKWIASEGRHFLFEKILLSAAQTELQKLPEQAGIHRKSTRSLNAGLELPKPRRKEMAAAGTMQTASLANIASHPGYVMDYTLVNINTNDFTFAGDTTYYVSGHIAISGQITLEGGTVIKYSPTNSAEIYSSTGNFNCQTMPYCPAILTARDDDTVGEIIAGSSGVPAIYVNAFEVHGAGSPVFNHLAVRYAIYGLSVYTAAASLVNDVQFVKCHVPLDFHSNLGQIRNCLFDRSEIPFAGDGYTYAVENATINDCTAQLSHTWSGIGTLRLTNCIAVALTNWGNASTIATNNSVASLTPMPWLFQSVAAGNYYLATNSPYRNVGWTNINSTLLAELGKKTTYPPILYSSNTFTSTLTLSPQAARDTDTPDLGYHYSPLDYVAHYVIVTNGDLLLTNGVAVGYCNNAGFLTWGSSGTIASIGTAETPNWLTRYYCVQEQPVSFGNTTALPFNQYHTTGSGPVGVFRFTKFAALANGVVGYHLYHKDYNWSFTNLLVQNCEFYNSSNAFSGITNTTAMLQNNLFRRSGVGALMPLGGGWSNWLAFSNNTFSSAPIQVVSRGSSNQWLFFNNAFDSVGVLAATTQPVVNGYNAYYNCTGNGRFTPTNIHDLVSTNSLTYQSGPLGDYYQPTNSALLNAGGTTADLTGLYHYTTTTNQVKETNTVVDIGYHYMAVNGSGLPVDSDNDGIPDYLEDANGDGNYAAPETDWRSADTDGDGVPDGLELIQGRNPRVAGAVADTTGVVASQLFTPLK